MTISENSGIKSKYLAWLLAIFLFVLHFFNRYYNYGNYFNLLGSDVLSYYIYLPFTFIYHDIGIHREDIVKYIFDTYNPSGTFYQTIFLPNGNRVPAYTMGFAILYLPFFFLGHLWALIGGYPKDGFSYPYQFCITNGVMLYILPGIFIVRKTLLRYFSDTVTTISLGLVVLGTTYFHEVFNDSTMPHAMMFTGIAAFVYLLDNWYRQPTKKNSFLLGLLAGFVILCRGSEIVIIFLAVFWNVRTKDDFIKRLLYFKDNLTLVLLIATGAALAFLPQIVYWKAMTGDFFYNSYQYTEGVDWRNPNLLKVLFSFKKSLLIYTPLYAIMFIGILMMKKRMPALFLPVLLFFLANLYLLSCWAAWWNGFSFGMRYFVESYSVMAIPLAVFSEWMLSRKVILKVSIAIVLGFFVFLNLFQTWQYCNYILDGIRMTKKYYAAIFLKTSVPKGAENLLEVRRTYGEVENFNNPQDYKHKTIGYFNYDDLNSGILDEECLDSTIKYDGKFSYRLDKDHVYSPVLQLPYYLVTEGDHAWIRVTLWYRSEIDLKENPASLVITMSRYGKGGRDNDKYRAIDLEKQEYKIGEWNYITYDYQTPMNLDERDKLTVYVWHRGNFPFYIEDLKVEDYMPIKH